ncbi:glycosyltransferase family 2 protein [Ancylobacter sp.]|uniref:glycosyltransferase family 2 protein n=1 Tax=Ancylobacter sp. TaxID=1872567 RepID=UPI003D0AB0DE
MSLDYSVVIPAYNAAGTLGEAIRSILAQTLPPDAIIVVDDGSTDDTAAVATAFGSPVTVVRQHNQGPGAATTAGFREVATPYFATLDADDVWLPPKMEVQAARLVGSPDITAAFSLARQFKDGETPDPHVGPEYRLWTRTTMVLKTESARQVGDFHDFPGRLGELVDWLGRSRDLGHRHVMVEEVLAMRRVRAGSLSHSIDATRARGYLVAVHQAMKRRQARQAGPDDEGSPV